MGSRGSIQSVIERIATRHRTNFPKVNPFEHGDPDHVWALIDKLTPFGEVREVPKGSPVFLGAPIIVLRGVVGAGYLDPESYIFSPYYPLIPGAPAQANLTEHYAREPITNQGAVVLVLPQTDRLPLDARMYWSELLHLEMLRQHEWWSFVRHVPTVLRLAILDELFGPLSRKRLASLADVTEEQARQFISVRQKNRRRVVELGVQQSVAN